MRKDDNHMCAFFDQFNTNGYKHMVINRPCYTGRVDTYFLISFLALQMELQCFILSGALFQALLASLMKVDCKRLDFPLSIN